MRGSWRLTVVLLVGCTFSTDPQREIDKHTTIVADKEGIEATQSLERLISHGRRAIPTIELALQQAKPPGRRNLVIALRRIGDGEAVPLLARLVVRDGDEMVRREARTTLEGWAKAPGERGDKARAALRTIDERSQREEAG
jgi:HEAT repeat protein